MKRTCGSSYNQYSRWIQVAKDWLGKYKWALSYQVADSSHTNQIHQGRHRKGMPCLSDIHLLFSLAEKLEFLLVYGRGEFNSFATIDHPTVILCLYWYFVLIFKNSVTFARIQDIPSPAFCLINLHYSIFWSGCNNSIDQVLVIVIWDEYYFQWHYSFYSLDKLATEDFAESCEALLVSLRLAGWQFNSIYNRIHRRGSFIQSYSLAARDGPCGRDSICSFWTVDSRLNLQVVCNFHLGRTSFLIHSKKCPIRYHHLTRCHW